MAEKEEVVEARPAMGRRVSMREINRETSILSRE